MSPGPNDNLGLPTTGQIPDRSFDERLDPFLEEDGGGVDIRRYLSALLRQRWLILGLGLVGLAAGAGLARVVKPSYEAQATIHIDVTSRNAAQSSPIRANQLLESRAWIDLLRSFEVMDEVVRRRRLFIEPETAADSALFREFALAPEFQPGQYRYAVGIDGAYALFDAEGVEVDRGAVGDSVGRALGFLWRPDARPAGASVVFRVRTPRDAAVALNAELQAQISPDNASFLRMQLRGKDARAVALTLNTIADRFIEVATVLKREKLTAATEALNAQRVSSAEILRRAEEALGSYQVNTITLPSDRGATPIAAGLAETRDPVFDAFFRLRIDRDALANQRDAVRAALATPGDSTRTIAVDLSVIPAVRESTELMATLTELNEKVAELRRMRLTFSPAHVPLQQLEREVRELEGTTVRSQALALISSLNARIAEFDQRIAASASEMQQIPPRMIEEARRRREVEIAQNLNTTLQTAYEQAKLVEMSATPDVRVLDRADPPTKPVTDMVVVIIAGGLAGGLGLGIVLALVLDHVDRRLHYPEQVSRELGLRILGALPKVGDGRHKRNADDAAHLIEALRSIRMNLQYAHGLAGTFVTTVTSPGSGDGKSFLSMNLANSFAGAGHRTLLIDGDTRRGAVHRSMGIDRRPGLLDHLAGNATIQEIIKRPADRAFDVIPCGTRLAGGPELLASSAMAQLLVALRGEYTAIIIDSPPLGAGVDPLVLAALSGTLIMVMRTGVTDRELAESRLGDLQRLPIRVLGAVLNDVKPEGIYRYYGYLPGYRAEDEVRMEAAASARVLPGPRR